MTVREALAVLQKQPETASDVSGHSGAQTFYLPQEGGLYLKRGARGALRPGCAGAAMVSGAMACAGTVGIRKRAV